jgi:outer membrane protein assembly factor BamA
VPDTVIDKEAHTAEVTFELRPGTETTFGPITIEGEKLVNERAIRRQLRIRPGDPYNANELKESVDAIYGLGMFRAVTPRVLNPNEQGAPMDIAIDVLERKPHSVQLGFGFSTVEQLRGEVQWTDRNLWGGAEQLSVSAKGSSIQQAGEARFLLPYFLAQRTSFTQTAFARNQPKLTQDQLGFGNTLFSIEDTTPAMRSSVLGVRRGLSTNSLGPGAALAGSSSAVIGLAMSTPISSVRGSPTIIRFSSNTWN